MQPRPTSRYRFALTPLADAMFQLLIFFMLTSSLTPYSLLTIRSGPQAGTATNDPGAAPGEDETVVPGENAAFWTVEEGQVEVGGMRFPFSDLPQLAAVLAQNDDTEVILIMESSAQVQDLASVLEALTAAGINAIQLARMDNT